MIDIISKQINGALENAIFNELIKLKLGTNNSVLRAIASRVAEEYAVTIAKTISIGTNKQLTSIPNNLLGTKNPVDLVTSNLGSSGITNNLNNIIGTQYTLQLTNLVVTAVERELKTRLPADKKNLINFSNLAAILIAAMTPTVSNTIGTALGSVVDSIFGGKKTIKPTLSNIESIFTSSGGDTAASLDIIDEGFASKTASKYLQEAQNFNVNNAENQEKLVVLKQGFVDPDANYPTKEYTGRPDTNKLATGDAAGTIIQSKNKERMIGAKLPGGEAWDEPESAYKGEYPYNKVTQTESGHIIEVDDTPGAERLHVFHSAGTYIEIDANGSMVRRIKGSSYEIIDRNGKIAISGRADISINGECNIFVGNDANIEVEGDTNIVCHNDITAQAGGTLNLSAREVVNITGTLVNIEAYDSMNVKSNVALTMSSNEIRARANVDMYLQSTNLYRYTGNEYNQTTGSLYEKIGGSRFSDTGGSVNFQPSGQFNVDGSATYLQSGASQGSQASKQTIFAGPSNIGILSGRKDIVYFDLFDPQPLTLKDTVTLDLEEQSAYSQEKRDQEDKIRTSGFATTDELNQRPIEQDKAVISSEQRITVPGSQDLLQATQLPGNYKLSPNFTLEMLTNKAAITKDTIETSELTYGQIVYNLQLVALNILEPVYNLYPNAFVTSGYRQRAKSSKTSQHPLGHAVDIQFRGASKADYFEIAKRLAKVLKYDQLLLEFCAYTNNPWIHISFTGKQERLQVMTFWNHSKHSDGLAQLA